MQPHYMGNSQLALCTRISRMHLRGFFWELRPICAAQAVRQAAMLGTSSHY